MLDDEDFIGVNFQKVSSTTRLRTGVRFLFSVCTHAFPSSTSRQVADESKCFGQNLRTTGYECSLGETAHSLGAASLLLIAHFFVSSDLL